MKTRTFRSAVALAVTLTLAGTASAASLNYRASGSIPLTESANDFHVRIAIPEPAAVGDPINFTNGPWGADGTVRHAGASFTVDWAGSTVSTGGPFDFAFDFTSDQVPVSPVPEAWWTLNGRQVGPNFGNLFSIRELPGTVPEPSSLAVFGVAMLLLLRRPVVREIALRAV